jgi:hypothetical protein
MIVFGEDATPGPHAAEHVVRNLQVVTRSMAKHMQSAVMVHKALRALFCATMHTLSNAEILGSDAIKVISEAMKAHPDDPRECKIQDPVHLRACCGTAPHGKSKLTSSAAHNGWCMR